MFEWDEKKNAENKRKHGIGFEEAKQIFDRPVLTQPDMRDDYDEERFISMGTTGGMVAVVVAHTDRAGRTRIISARRANRKEKRIYHEHLKETFEAFVAAWENIED